MNSIEFAYLRKTVLLFSLLIILSVLLSGTGCYFTGARQDRLAGLENHLSVLTHRVSEAQEAREAVIHYRSLYEKISAEGFLSDEPRLLWVERLESSANQLHLTALRYSVSPQQKRQVNNMIALNHSSMTIEAELLHEEDLIYLLGELARPAVGLLTVESCQLQYLPELKVSPLSNTLRSKCLLSWYTAQQSESTVGNDETDPALEGI